MFILQVEGKNVDAAEAGAVAKQHQHANPHQCAAHQCRVERRHVGKFDPPLSKLGEQRDQANGNKGAQRKAPPHAFDRQIVKRQVDGKKPHAKSPPGQVIEQ